MSRIAVETMPRLLTLKLVEATSEYNWRIGVNVYF